MRGTYAELSTNPLFQAIISHVQPYQGVKQEIAGDADQANESQPPEAGETEDAPMLQQDARQEGIVKFSVYIKFIRAGIGIVGGILLLILYCVHQGLGMFNNWWLAVWSESEGQRYGLGYECRNETVVSRNGIGSNMTDVEWKQYKDTRFYVYAGMYDPSFRRDRIHRVGL